MKRFPLAILLFLIPAYLFAQDDLMNILDQNTPKEINYTTATFKSTRILNGQSIEKMAKGQLDFRISHRFGPVNSGSYNLFGLDQSNIHFGLDYGINKWLMVGLGRGSYEKTFDGFTKVTLLRQSSGAKVTPVSVSAFGSVALKTQKPTNTQRTNYFSSKLSYSAQVLIARKFSQSFSFQLTPSYVHRNLVPTELDPNDLFALGAGGRMKLSKRISLNAEYFFLANPKSTMSQQIYDPFSIGVDIETGGHVFQLFFTNSIHMIEPGFIGETTGSWGKGDIRFGFNISRVFNLNKEKKVQNY